MRMIHSLHLEKTDVPREALFVFGNLVTGAWSERTSSEHRGERDALTPLSILVRDLCLIFLARLALFSGTVWISAAPGESWGWGRGAQGQRGERASRA
ncbi:hypothetical protein AOLI_G00254640 [Acnodon oligacanthus]